jgi:glycerophosphoryl diester phosphodiesterase
MSALIRVGHKGADGIVAGNTLASFDAALDVGVDMIEFDVLEFDGRLVLAHDDRDARRRHPPTLEEGLDHLAASAFDGLRLDVDLKLPGYEARVLQALRDRDLLPRCLISSQYVASLADLRLADPSAGLGWSVPKAARDYTRSRAYKVPAYAALRAYRATFPRRAARALRERRVDAIMAHWRLVSPALVRAVKGAGGDLYVWTVDEAESIRRFEDMGVTGVITNDPRLFQAVGPTPNAQRPTPKPSAHTPPH